MAITRMELTGLTVFEHATFDFVPGINVLLGANSTGKTHALKWLYGTVKALEHTDRQADVAAINLLNKLPGIFRPAHRAMGLLAHSRGPDSEGSVQIDGDEGQIRLAILGRGVLDLSVSSLEWSAQAQALFIPSREVLSLYEGFIAAYSNRELSVDETYFDACVALSAALLRGPRAEVVKPLVEAAETLLGGRVELVGERFYVSFRDSPSYSLEAHLVAEGLRKIASLVRLLQNGSIAPGGLLVWDEPETNLNARLVAALVPILEALAKAGVQIVLATHDYLLSKRLSLLSEADSPEQPPVKFFLLSRPTAGAPVEVASGPTLAELPRTPMEEEFLRLYDDERHAYVGG